MPPWRLLAVTVPQVSLVFGDLTVPGVQGRGSENVLIRLGLCHSSLNQRLEWWISGSSGGLWGIHWKPGHSWDPPRGQAGNWMHVSCSLVSGRWFQVPKLILASCVLTVTIGFLDLEGWPPWVRSPEIAQSCDFVVSWALTAIIQAKFGYKPAPPSTMKT